MTLNEVLITLNEVLITLNEVLTTLNEVLMTLNESGKKILNLLVLIQRLLSNHITTTIQYSLLSPVLLQTSL